jgi:hypothetical protein
MTILDLLSLQLSVDGLVKAIASGSSLTFESHLGLPSGAGRASLTHANGNTFSNSVFSRSNVSSALRTLMSVFSKLRATLGFDAHAEENTGSQAPRKSTWRKSRPQAHLEVSTKTRRTGSNER